MGVLDIDITTLYRRFRGHQQSLRTFKRVVEDFLGDEIGGKQWQFHPSYHRKLKAAKEEAA